MQIESEAYGHYSLKHFCDKSVHAKQRRWFYVVWSLHRGVQVNGGCWAKVRL